MLVSHSRGIITDDMQKQRVASIEENLSEGTSLFVPSVITPYDATSRIATKQGMRKNTEVRAR